MSNDFIVNSFTIELNFSEKVMAGLQRLERKVLPMAERIEKKLDNAFRVDAGKLAQPGIQKMVRNVERAGKQINRTLNRAFQIDNLGRSSIRGFESEGIQSARRVAREFRRAFSASLPASTPSVPRPGGRPRPTAGDTLARNQGRISDLHQRQTTSAQYGNMLLRTPERATEYRTRLNALRDQHAATGDLDGFRHSVRQLNFETSQTSRAQAIARRAEQEAARAAETGLGGLTNAAGGLFAAFLTAQKAVEYFTESLKVGVERYQSRVSFEGAFGGAGSENAQHMEAVVGGIIDKYGLNKAESMQTVANLRYSLPKKAFTDEQVAKLFENESIFAHQTGMTPDQVFRTNHILAETADMKHMGGAQIMAMSRDAPALFAQMAKQHGMTADEYREHLKQIPGVDAVKEAVDTMEKFNIETKAAAGAMHNVQASLGRYQNALDDQKEAFFKGYSDGFQNLLNSLTMNLKDSQGTMKTLGKVLGGAFIKIAATMYALDQLTSNISGAIGLIGFAFKDFVKEQSEPLQKDFGKLFKDIRNGLDSLFDSPLVSLIRHFAPQDKKPDKTGENHWYDKPLKWLDTVNELNPLARANKVVAKASGDAYDIAADATKQSWGKGENGNLAPLVKFARAVGKFAENFNSSIPAGGFGGYSAPPVTPMSQGSARTQAPLRVEVAPRKLEFEPITLNVNMPDGSTQAITAEIKQRIQDHHETVMMSAQGLGGQWQQQGKNAGWNPSQLMKKVAQ
ncbi:hypothetical protein [Enterobacter bugandensis]|uniref:hypothetical protein n=1 Tax=Enterobacter bugandensis TaxID=881260 RepID=UPI002075653F|nr:hypothetical protein [Enterobacter bugandensis]MCM7468120.1 hypothetical protein [Enterobacter bugandensis]